MCHLETHDSNTIKKIFFELFYLIIYDPLIIY